jgi:hypothetical protein
VTGDSVVEVGHAGGIDDADRLQADRATYVVEEADTTTEQQGHLRDHDLVEQSGPKALLCGLRTGEATFLSCAASLACLMALSTPSVT